MQIPSDRQIRRLHEKYAPTGAAFELVHGHCEIVCAIAERLVPDGADADLVRAGSLTGMGISRDDVLTQGLPLPVADHLAVAVEERLVMYADKFHTKTDPPRFLTADAYAAYVARFGEDKVAAFTRMRAAFGEPDLT